MNCTASELKSILGSSDRPDESSISSKWKYFRACLADYLSAAYGEGTLFARVRSHTDHLDEHYKDKEAATRLEKLSAQHSESEARRTGATIKVDAALADYRQSILAFAGIPLEQRSEAKVDIIDDRGSARIYFGRKNESGQRSETLVSYANGKLRCKPVHIDLS